MSEKNSRRDFLSTSGAFLSTAAAAAMLPQSKSANAKSKDFSGSFRPAQMKDDDKVNISKDYKYSLVVSAEDKISDKLIMGENCDFLHFMPGKNNEHGFIWANNEALHHNVVWGKPIKSSEKSKNPARIL